MTQIYLPDGKKRSISDNEILRICRLDAKISAVSVGLCARMYMSIYTKPISKLINL